MKKLIEGSARVFGGGSGTCIAFLLVAVAALGACSSDPNSPFAFLTTEQLKEHGCYAPSRTWDICQKGTFGSEQLVTEP